jgi:hypothetical protein
MEEMIEHFRRIEFGKWTCVRGGEFQTPTGRIQVAVGTTFTRGTMFMGYDIARALDEQYENSRMYRTPAGAKPNSQPGA